MLTLLVVDIFRVYEFLIVAYCLLSWFPGAYESKIGQLLIKLCQPYLDLFDFIPPIAGISFSPIVALIVLEFAEKGALFLMGILIGAANGWNISAFQTGRSIGHR